MSPRARSMLLAAAAVVVLINVIVLAGVAWNRSGEPEVRLRLSERELGVPGIWGRSREDSGLALHLRWRVPVANPLDDAIHPTEHGAYVGANWLNVDKLAALGFDVRPLSDEHARRYRRQQAREVWLALELDGPAYEDSVRQARAHLAAAEQALAERPDERPLQDRAKAARQLLTQASEEWSRLFVIDADRDPRALRVRYPDRERHAIVHGRVRPVWRVPDPRKQREREWRGHVEAVSIASIHVPLEFREAFESLLDDTQARRAARYQVMLAYGKRREPWIVEVQPTMP